VVTEAAVLLRLDDAVFIPGHAIFGNAKARRVIVNHKIHPEDQRAASSTKLKGSGLLFFNDLKNYTLFELSRGSVEDCAHSLGITPSFANYLAEVLFGCSQFDY
jgi:hypothetical protein